MQKKDGRHGAAHARLDLGRAGDDQAFRYRAAYISPADIQEALNGQALPFVEGGISTNAGLHRAAAALLQDFQRPLSRLEYQDALYDLAFALQAAAGCAVAIKRANREAAADARDYCFNSSSVRTSGPGSNSCLAIPCL
mgnify:CR=1 FL=1